MENTITPNQASRSKRLTVQDLDKVMGAQGEDLPPRMEIPIGHMWVRIFLS